MAELNFGSDSEGFARALEQMEALQAAKAELDAKDQALRGSEEAATGAIIDNTSALQRAIDQTRQLSAATDTLTESLRAETSVIAGNTAAWEARVAAMAEAAALAPRVQRASAGSRSIAAADVEAAAVATEQTPAPRRRPPPLEPPPTIYQSAEYQAQLAAAERQRAAAIAGAEQVAAAERQSLLRPWERATAAPMTSPLAGAAARVEQASQAYAQPRETGRPLGGFGQALGSERILYPQADTGAGHAARENAAAFREQMSAEREAAAELGRLREAQAQAAAGSAAMAQEQARVNLAYNQSVAAYAESSSALSRNGALTTEFIQAFARGDVTLKEFESQMVSTIGKFGGWAVAGGLVYGAYDAIKKLGEGAKDTQEGVQQLSRFIPGAAGPQRGALEAQFRGISTDLNVPINEVTAAMQVMARTFHNVSDAGEATRAVLLAGRLDQIPLTQSENYFTGISQSLGFSNQPGGGAQLLGVVNSLNALQNQYGARVNQTLPALARAAPAAQAAGVSTPLLEALVGVGVRSGIPGAQVGTALLRSMGTFAFRPGSEQILRGYGLDPQRGHYGDLVNQIVARITNPAPGHELRNTDLQSIATAIGGPLLGTRTLLPILEHANLIPGMEATAAHPPSAQEELGKVLGGVGEEFKRLGIEIENIGSALESAGLLQPIQVLLQAIGALGSALQTVLTPIDLVAHQFDQLPGPMREVFGLIVGAAAARRLAQSNVGFTAQQAIGRLPGLSALRNDPESAIRGTVARYRTFQIPETERQLENARRGVVVARRDQRRTLDARDETAIAAEAAPADPVAQEAAERAQQAYSAATQRAATAAEREAVVAAQLAEEQGLVMTLTNNRLSTAEKINLIESQQLAVSTQTLETMENNAKAEAERFAIIARGGGGGVGGAAGGASEIETFAGTGAAALSASVLAGRASTGAVRAFQQGTPAEQAAIMAEGAEVEQPGLLTEAMTGGTFTARGATPELASAGSEESVVQAGLLARLRTSPAADALRGAGGRVATAATGVRANPLGALGNVDPLMWLIGAQVAGGVLPGGVGNVVGQAGTAAALGLWGGSMGGAALGRLIGRGAGFFGLEAGGAEAALANPLFGLGAGLTVAGATTRGGVGLGEGIAGGAAIGTAIEPGIGTAVGAAVGAGVHFLGTDVLGAGKGDQVSEAATRRQRQLRQLQERVSGGTANLGNLSDFSFVFGQELTGAFQDGNQTDAQAQQQAVQKAISNNVQLLKAAGTTSTIGQGARSVLTQAIGAAIGSPTLRVDPYDVGQVIDTSVQGLNTGVSNRFGYQLAQSTSGAGDQRALAGAVEGVQQNYTEAVSNTITQLTENFNALWSSLQRDPTNKGLRQQVAQAKSLISQARAFGAQINVQDIATLQQDAAAALQQQVQRISDEAGVASARAGGNRMQQLRVQLSQATRDYNAAWGNRNLAPQARRSEEENSQAQQIQARTAMTQQRATELQARGTVAASVIPSFDPVQQAQQNLRNAAAYYTFVRSHANAFDPADINNALAARNSAYQALADARYQYDTSLISGRFGIVQAQNPFDPATVARGQVAEGRQQLAIARNTPERQAAQATIIQGQMALREAAQQSTQTAYQITEANEGGDPVAQALTQIAAARQALASALGPQQAQQAQLQYAQAVQALHQASQQQITDIGALRASETNDPVKQDQDRLAAARRALAEAIGGHYGAATVRQDQTAVNQAVLQHTNDYVSQRLSTIQFQQSTLQVSAQGALSELQGLLKLKNLSISQRQQIQQQVYAIETNQSNTSLFDLAPAGSSVRTPTIYDVRTAAARERSRLRSDVGGLHGPSGTVQIGGATVNTTQGSLNTHDNAVEQAIKDMHGTMAAGGFGAGAGGDVAIIVNVGNAGEAHKVADAIDRTMGTRVKARMRSAGVRGT